MRFSLFLSFFELNADQDGSRAFEEHLEQAILADRLGYDSVSVPEHPLVHLVKAPSALLNAVAIGQHVKCDVGASVITVPLHHPLALAGEIAAADHALGGRLVVGLGRGAYRFEFDRFGVDFSESRDRLVEAVDIMEKVWQSPDDGVDFQGKFHSFPKSYVWPRPKQDPHPPLWIAAQSPASIEWSVSRGHNVMNSLMRRPDSVLEQICRTFHEKREEYGYSREELQLSITRPCFVTQDQAMIRKRLDQHHDLHRVHTHMHNFTKSADNRGFIAPSPVEDQPTDEDIQTGILLGSGERILERLERYAELGVDEISLGMGYGAPHEEVMESIQAFAESVMAPFRRSHAPTPAPRVAYASRSVIDLPAATSDGSGAATTTESSVRSKAWIDVPVGRKGNGPDLVLVHDSGAAKESLFALRDELSRWFTTHLFDRRGRGRTGNEATYSLQREAEMDVLEVVNAARDRAVVVGVGYGAALAPVMMPIAQTPIQSLVLVGGGEEPAANKPALSILHGEIESLLKQGDRSAAVLRYYAGRYAMDDDQLRELQGLDTWPSFVASADTLTRELRSLIDYTPEDAVTWPNTSRALLVATQGAPRQILDALSNVGERAPNVQRYTSSGRYVDVLREGPVVADLARRIADFAGVA